MCFEVIAKSQCLRFVSRYRQRFHDLFLGVRWKRRQVSQKLYKKLKAFVSDSEFLLLKYNTFLVRATRGKNQLAAAAAAAAKIINLPREHHHILISHRLLKLREFLA